MQALAAKGEIVRELRGRPAGPRLADERGRTLAALLGARARGLRRCAAAQGGARGAGAQGGGGGDPRGRSDLLRRGGGRGGAPVHRVGADRRPHRRPALRRRRPREEGRGHRAHRRARREPGASRRARRRCARPRPTLRNARAQYERSQQLLAQKFMSQAALDKAEADYKAAQARLTAMLAGAGQAATERSFATIVAPYSGVVVGAPRRAGRDGGARQAAHDRLRSRRRCASSPPCRRRRSRAIQAARQGAHRGALARRAGSTCSQVTVVPSADPRTHTTQVRLELPADARGVYPGRVRARALRHRPRAAPAGAARARSFQRSEVDRRLRRRRQGRAAAAPDPPRHRVGDETLGRGARGPEAGRARRARAGEGRHGRRRRCRRAREALTAWASPAASRASSRTRSSRRSSRWSRCCSACSRWWSRRARRSRRSTSPWRTCSCPFPGASAQRRRGAGGHARRAGARADRAASSTSTRCRARAWRCSRCSSRWACRALEALVRLYDTIQANRDWVSPRAGRPASRSSSPRASTTCRWSRSRCGASDPQRGAYELERVAHAAEIELKRVPGTREVQTLGGPGRAVRVLLDADRLAAHGVSALDVRNALQLANVALPTGKLVRDNREIVVETGNFLDSAADVRALVVGAVAGAAGLRRATSPRSSTARTSRRATSGPAPARRRARARHRASIPRSRCRSPRSRARTRWTSRAA